MPIYRYGMLFFDPLTDHFLMFFLLVPHSSEGFLRGKPIFFIFCIYGLSSLEYIFHTGFIESSSPFMVKKGIILNIIPVFAISLVLLSGSITSADAIIIVQNSTPMDLVDEITGPGITIVGVPTLAGGPVQSGIFTDGFSEVGMPDGIVLHSGNVAMIAGPNGNAGVGFPE